MIDRLFVDEAAARQQYEAYEHNENFAVDAGPYLLAGRRLGSAMLRECGRYDGNYGRFTTGILLTSEDRVGDAWIASGVEISTHVPKERRRHFKTTVGTSEDDSKIRVESMMVANRTAAQTAPNETTPATPAIAWRRRRYAVGRRALAVWTSELPLFEAQDRDDHVWT